MLAASERGKRRIKSLVPFSAQRTFRIPLDRRAYRRGNLIEQLSGQLKDWCRIGPAGSVRQTRLEQGGGSAQPSGMTQRSRFRYFKTSPEILRLAVMM